MLGTEAVSWSSKKQLFVTLSATEAEFISATASACQVIWSGRILEELRFKQVGNTTIFFVTTTQKSDSSRIMCHTEEANILM
jgi:hypothetical protein